MNGTGEVAGGLVAIRIASHLNSGVYCALVVLAAPFLPERMEPLGQGCVLQAQGQSIRHEKSPQVADDQGALTQDELTWEPLGLVPPSGIEPKSDA